MYTQRDEQRKEFEKLLTCFNADAGAADLASLVLCSAEVVIVVDEAIEGRWREGVELQSAIGMDMADVGDIVDVVASSQVPAEDCMGGATCWAGQGHPH